MRRRCVTIGSFFCQTRLIARFLLEPSPILEALGNRSFNYGLRWPFSFLGTRLLDGSHQQELARRLVFSLSLSLNSLRQAAAYQDGIYAERETAGRSIVVSLSSAPLSLLANALTYRGLGWGDGILRE